MNSNNQLQKIALDLPEVLKSCQNDLVKPFQMGKAMELANDIVKYAVSFLEAESKRTFDDPDLLEEIEKQKKRHRSVEQKIELFIEKNPEFEEELKKAEDIEKRHKALKDNHAKYKEIVKRNEDLERKIKEIEDLGNEAEVYKSNCERYQAHYAENEQLLQNILKYNSTSPKEDVQNVSNEIKRMLGQFDQFLTRLIESRDKLPIHELKVDVGEAPGDNQSKIKN